MDIVKQSSVDLAYGLLLVIGITMISLFLNDFSFFTNLGLSALVIAILIGIVIGNLFILPIQYQSGIDWVAKKILRLAIILYGFRVSFQDMLSVGWSALMIDCFVVSATLFFGYHLGKKILKIDSDMALLISAGAAICGVAAVLAVEDVIKSDAHKASVAVGTVVLFGTLSMFLYPYLQNHAFLPFNPSQFAIFTGASTHEVAQTLVAASSVSEEAGKMAVIVKMIRVLLLVPVLFCLSLKQKKSYASQRTRFNIPWFAVGFIIMIAVNSLTIIPDDSVKLINHIDVILLTMAMSAVGLETKWCKIKQVGVKPLYLACLLFFWLFSSVSLLVTFNC